MAARATRPPSQSSIDDDNDSYGDDGEDEDNALTTKEQYSAATARRQVPRSSTMTIHQECHQSMMVVTALQLRGDKTARHDSKHVVEELAGAEGGKKALFVAFLETFQHCIV